MFYIYIIHILWFIIPVKRQKRIVCKLYLINWKLSIYDGIGLVDINIEPHLDSASKDHMKDIHEASQHAVIYGLYDNAFIKIIDNKLKIYGTYFKYES